MTRHSAWITACIVALTALTRASSADAHGTPIHVEVPADELIVSGGWPDSIGFAPVIFGEDDEDGEPFATITLPQVGPVILWQLPGLDIFGMNDQSNLSIEPLPRPAKDASPTEKRLVWHWDPVSEEVTVSPSAFNLLGTGMRFTTLAPTVTDEPAPFLLANTVAGQQGFHNHGLISYALDNDPSRPVGAYGFFARLLSDEHDASDPFLLVFNRDVDAALMMSAGLAINAAAFLPGDYNHDDRVDAADYVVWRKTLGSTTDLIADGSGNLVVDTADYEVWRANFGLTYDQSPTAAPGSLASAPEPRGSALAAAIFVALAARFRRRARTPTRDNARDTTEAALSFDVFWPAVARNAIPAIGRLNRMNYMPCAVPAVVAPAMVFQHRF
jgi:hypothetical protein